METGLYFLFFMVSLVSLLAFVLIAIKAFQRSVLWGLGVVFVPFVIFVYGFKFLPEVKKPFYAYLGTTVASVVLIGYLFTMMGGMEAISLASKMNDGTMTEQDAAEFMVASMEGMEKVTGIGKEEMIRQMQQDPDIRPEDVEQAKKLFDHIEGMANGTATSFEIMQATPATQDADLAPAPTEQDVKQAEEALRQAMAMLESMPVGNESANNSAATTFDSVAETMAASPVLTPATVQQNTPSQSENTGPISPAQADRHIGQTMEITMKAGNKRYGRLLNVANGNLAFEHQTYGGSISYKINATDIKSLMLQ